MRQAGEVYPGFRFTQSGLRLLSDDYMTVPVDKVGELHSLLTMLGGRAVYGEGAYAVLGGK
jgi:hypothetical protein